MSEIDRNLNASESTDNFASDSEKIATSAPESSVSNNCSPLSSATPKPLGENSDADSNASKTANKTMDWQKVAHKLREYNRKLLKKVFKLEQDLAEVDNKFQKHLEKSKSSDLLNAKQAEEIKEYQQENDRLEQQVEIFQQETHSQQLVIERLSQELELSQKQSAQLERECALLQENYNKKTYELIATGKEAQELHSRLNRQQNYTLQYKAALDRYVNEAEEKSAETGDLKKVQSQELADTAFRDRLPQIKNTPIQAWSGSSLDRKLTLPKTKSQILPIKNSLQSSAKTHKGKASTKKSSDLVAPEIGKGKKTKQLQSLAAVELPQLPRQV